MGGLPKWADHENQWNSETGLCKIGIEFIAWFRYLISLPVVSEVRPFYVRPLLIDQPIRPITTSPTLDFQTKFALLRPRFLAFGLNPVRPGPDNPVYWNPKSGLGLLIIALFVILCCCRCAKSRQRKQHMKKRIEYDEQLNVTNDLIVKPNASLYDKGKRSNKPLELGFSLT